MKLRSLEAFCAAVEEGTISGAARRMYLSQPSVSERLAELEREAHVPLLKRSRQGVQPTEQGALLYEHARKVLDEIHALDRVLQTLRTKRDMRLRFAASSTLGEHLLPEWLGEFRKKMPKTSPEVFVGNTQEVVQMVGKGEVAFGVIEGEEHYHSAIESLPLLDDELVVVVTPGHPWTRRGIIVEDLPKEPFISREKGSGTREVIERALREMGDVSLNIQMEIGSTSGIKEAIEAGLGFSILSRAAIRLEVRAGNLAIADGVVISRRFSLIRHTSAKMSPVEQGFYDYLMRVREKSGVAWNVVE
jgi:DNA-binding transcriptional LysR family regulator